MADETTQAPPIALEDGKEALEKALKKSKVQRTDKVRACILETLETLKGVVAGSNLEGAGFRALGKFEDGGKEFQILIDVTPQVFSTGELGV